MPKLSPDPTFSLGLRAAASEDAACCRKPSPALLIFIIPLLGFAGLAYGMEAHPLLLSSSQGRDSIDPLDRSQMKAVHLADLAAAHRNVLFWTEKTSHPTETWERDQAKLRNWKRSYGQRRALFARMYPGETVP